MKRLVCTFFSLLFVFTVYADTTYTATAGGSPAEVIVTAYKNSVDVGENKTNIVINNLLGDDFEISGINEYRIPANALLNNNQSPVELFYIIYETNSFENKIKFKVDISLFEEEDKEERIEEIVPLMKYNYEFIPEKNNMVTDMDYKNKYNPDSKDENLSIFDSSEYNKSENDIFEFKCYPNDENLCDSIYVEKGDSYPITYYAKAKFTAIVYLSLEDFKPDNYDGLYLMNVNVVAEIEGK